MPVSEFRSIELMDIGSLAKETIHNDAVNNLSRGVSGFKQIAIDLQTEVYLVTDSDDLSLYATLAFTGELTAACTIIAPNRARVYILDNRTTGTYSLTIKTSAGNGVILTQGARTLCYSDSVNIYGIGEGSGGILPIASESLAGVTRYGTDAESITGALRTVAVHPAGLRAALLAWPGPPQATTSVAGVAPLATTAEGTAGTNTTKIVTPAVLQAKINALPLASETVVGLAERATSQEAIDGLDPTRYVSPASLKAVIDTLPVAPITGTPFSVLRIPSSGTGQEASPLTIDATSLAVLQGRDLVVKRSSGNPTVALDGVGGSQRVLVWRTGGLARWHALVTSGAETGSNAGSDWQLLRRDDSGGILGTVLSVQRSNGFVGMGMSSGSVPQAPLHIQNSDLLTGQLILGSQRVQLMAGHVLSGLEFWSNDSNLPEPGQAVAYVRAVASQAHSAGVLGTQLAFGVTPTGTATLLESLVIRSNGFVGLGLSAGVVAQAPLHVISASLTSGQLILGSQRGQITASQVLGGVEFWSNDGNLVDPGALTAYIRCRATSSHTATDLGSELQWGQTPAGSTTPAEVLRINALGSLLLGGASAGEGMAPGIAVKAGVAPSNSPPGVAQMWVENLDGVASTAAWHFRSEDGVVTKIGTGLLARKSLLVAATSSEAAPLVLTAAESGRVIAATNTTAKTQVNLPSAVAGLTYTVLGVVVQGVRIRAASGDQIAIGGVGASGSAGYAETTTQYAAITLVAYNANFWLATAMVGTWTVGT